MNRDMEEEIHEVLYEIKRHSSGPCTSNYPPHLAKESQVGERASRVLGWVKGIAQIRKRWGYQKILSNVRKNVSMFISRNSFYVAIATGNKITILQKGDDYQQPCGIFTCNEISLFTYGAWSEHHDILGVCDEYQTLYFIKPNGEEVARIVKRLLNLSGSILGIIPISENMAEKYSLCIFIVLCQDGFQILDVSGRLHGSNHIDQSDSCVFPTRTFSENVFCFDYNSKQDLLALVGSVIDRSGPSDGNFGYLHLWHLDRNNNLRVLSTIQFMGSYVQPNDSADSVVHPKVVISPSCSLIATLDILGSLHIFKISKNIVDLSKITQKDDSLLSAFPLSTEFTDLVSDVADFTWWSDCTIALVKKTGLIIMLNVFTGKVQLEDSLLCSNFLIEKGQLLQGLMFFLEVTCLDQTSLPQSIRKESNLHSVIGKSERAFKPLNLSCSHWSLFSISSRSVSEVYQKLIYELQYSEALDFAIRYGLDQDNILKSQWLHSPRDVKDVHMYFSYIRDHAFIVSEALETIGPTEDTVNAILTLGLQVTDQYQSLCVQKNDSDASWGFLMNRLRLLQFKDRLKTYLGINMGRFSAAEYAKFRSTPLSETASELAESGKLGALNLLFKRHTYSLCPCLLEILASIPETIHVQTYEQLLPGKSPSGIILREEDWVECEHVFNYIRKLNDDHKMDFSYRTELVVKHVYDCSWPSYEVISTWYKNRALEIDGCSGQLDNCLSLIDFGCSKGFSELQNFREDVLYLSQLIYAAEDDDIICCDMSLAVWGKFSDYERFRVMLKNVTGYNMIKRLKHLSIPFMKNRQNLRNDVHEHLRMEDRNIDESFLVKWLKEVASENKLDECLVAIEEACNLSEKNVFFEDDLELIECALQCIYLCSVTDKWNTMGAILSKLPQAHDAKRELNSVERRLKVAQGHIEAGRLLAFYQVPKPINFFLEAHSDEKGIKQILRLILSKFVRRQPSRPDTDWANLWRDFQSLKEKAFNFLDSEFMLMEFCRGLLKAGKFSLARNYLSGTGLVPLTPEKAENLVIQAARDYFFSASSFSCNEVWKAKECLNIFPNSSNVKAEMDVMDALTIKLPDLGVSLLPMQFKQIQDPMEVIKLAIASQAEAYLRVDDLLDVAKLLGMRCPYELSVVEEAIAREAAIAGDLQLAFDLCLNLVRKGHGAIWDLCAAIARGPPMENMDINSRKHLLGFALSYCDEESVGELLHDWKDLEIDGQRESLLSFRGINYHDATTTYDPVRSDDEDDNLGRLKRTLELVTKNIPTENGTDIATLFERNRKAKTFATFQLPWLINLCNKSENCKQVYSGVHSNKLQWSLRAQASLTILPWLAQNGFTPKDDLIAVLAKSMMDPPVTEHDDIQGCLLLLNLVDAFSGVKVIEEQLILRKNYREICSVMNMGMIYSALHESAFECQDPSQRRELLFKKFREKHRPLTSDEVRSIEREQTTFWSNWKIHLEEKKFLTERSKMIEEVIPDVETARFLSGDSKYIESAILTLIDSLKFKKKHIINQALKLAETYGLPRNVALQHFISAILVSEVWSIEDIMAELLGFRDDIISYPHETIETISISVYPSIDGRDKRRLAFIFSILSDCYLMLGKFNDSVVSTKPSNLCILSFLDLARFYKVLEQECQRISFIQSLDFKNVAGLNGINEQCFNGEVYSHLNEFTLETLAIMVRELSTIYPDPIPEGLLSWQDVYKHHVLSLFAAYEIKIKAELDDRNDIISEKFLSCITLLEQNFIDVQAYIRILSPSDALDMMKRYFTVVISFYGSYLKILDNSSWQDCLIVLSKFWLSLTEEMESMASHAVDKLLFNPVWLSACLKSFIHLVMEDSISPQQGWGILNEFVSHCFVGEHSIEVHSFCRTMVLSGCSYGTVLEVFSKTVLQFDPDCSINALPSLYISMLDVILEQLVHSSSEHQRLFNLLSSLSKLEDKIDEFLSVRKVVWERLAQFSNNPHLVGDVRVLVLELMQYIAGKSIKCFSQQLESNVLPWEGWYEFMNIGKTNDEISMKCWHDDFGTSTKFTSTLVALRSSQLVAPISSIEITSDDLSNVDSAVSCFLKFCNDCRTTTHIRALLALLDEWDGMFSAGDGDAGSAIEEVEVANDWSNDWDVEWDSFTEEEIHGKEKALNYHVHPLHICWMEVFKCLIKLSLENEIMKVLDNSLAKPGVTLLDEEETKSIILLALEKDCMIACNIALLFPYKSVNHHCLDALQKWLKEGVVPENIKGAHDFVMLLLSSGIMSAILNEATYGTIMSFICYLIGNLGCQCQQYVWSRLNNLGSCEDAKMECFRRFMLPAFLSELVKAEKHMLAGYFISKFMHTNTAFSVINIAGPCIIRYLEIQKKELEKEDFSPEQIGTLDWMNSYARLKEKLRDLIDVSLNMLS